MTASANRIPWKGINDFFVAAGEERSIEGFASFTVAAVERLLPYDANALFAIEEKGGRIASWASRVDCDAWMSRYNDHFHGALPCVPQVTDSPVEWKSLKRGEFITDFLFPQGIGRTITVFAVDSSASRPGASLVLHRTRSSPPFGDADRRVCSILRPHLNNLFALHRLRAKTEAGAPSAESLVSRFDRLSRREAEVASLLCRGFTTGMICSALFISRPTVYKHIEHIYSKLGVGSRAMLLRTIGIDRNVRGG